MTMLASSATSAGAVSDGVTATQRSAPNRQYDEAGDPSRPAGGVAAPRQVAGRDAEREHDEQQLVDQEEHAGLVRPERADHELRGDRDEQGPRYGRRHLPHVDAERPVPPRALDEEEVAKVTEEDEAEGHQCRRAAGQRSESGDLAGGEPGVEQRHDRESDAEGSQRWRQPAPRQGDPQAEERRHPQQQRMLDERIVERGEGHGAGGSILWPDMACR
jgi:hypothetical protein